MTSREFFYMVAEMRTCQKAYFKSRDQLTLRAARKLENTIDKEIERVRLIVNHDIPPAAAPAPPCTAPEPSTNDASEPPNDASESPPNDASEPPMNDDEQ